MMTEAQKQQMAEAVAQIRQTMAEAARRAGRDPGEVALCAACKTRTVEEVRYSADLPIDLFGENHVQELVEKTDAGAYHGKPGHFIGHLQTNKVNKVVGRAALIQSVDSARLLDKIEAAAARLGITQEILIDRRRSQQERRGAGGSVAAAGRGRRQRTPAGAGPDGDPARRRRGRGYPPFLRRHAGIAGPSRRPRL